MSRLRQFLLLIWKNFKLQARHPWVTLFELGVPTLFAIILVCIRTVVDSEYVSHSTIYEPFSVDHLHVKWLHTHPEWKILYAPNATHLQDVMGKVSERLHVASIDFSNENELLQYYSNFSDQTKIIGGVIFHSETSNSSDFISDISYTIRPKALTSSKASPGKPIQTWVTEYTFPMLQGIGPRSANDSHGGAPGYLAQGFLPLQHAVAMSVIESLKKKKVDDMFDIKMQRYPYPPYDDDQFLIALQFFFPLILMLSFIYPSLNIVKNLVMEKEKKLKEAMKMMGLSNWMHWTAWYLKYFLFLCISVAIITALFSIKFQDDVAVLNKSDPSVIFLLLLIYTASTICSCFFLSVFFSKANSAAAGAGIIFFMSFVPYFFIFPRYNELNQAEKLASCLLPNTALAMASMVLTMWESSGTGLQWSGLKIPASPDDTLTMNLVLMMLIFDGIMYIVLAWYVEAVFPGEYGVPEPWYFPFTRTYWFGTQQDLHDMSQLYNSNEKNGEFFEREPNTLMPGIQIQGLTKVYHKKKAPAVNNAHINMYRGQITVLLGHNGAGKTTTISMLTGLYPPTSGTAVVNGYDICDDIEGVHSGMGICPQHDVLFDDLTVEEHLYFFCKLKGYISDLVQSEIDRILASIGLEDKRKALAKTLSGGMKRKLSVGIALVGGSQVVMLDEPTSGMDPSARRFTWDLLQAEKEDRTILLTTHFMEEADVLGDRIAIMANGEIQCCGSPLFLKKKYGAGYHLVMVKEPDCDVPSITELICSYVPSAEMSNNIGTELTYILPHTSRHMFERLFFEIETKKEQLKISSYGASITTMEEVFIKVGQNALNMETLKVVKDERAAACSSPLTDSGVHVLDDEQTSTSDTRSDIVICGTRNEPLIKNNSGVILFFQQLWALLLKRILFTFRNRVLTLSQFLLPPFFLVLTLIVVQTLPKPRDSPALQFSLNPFHGTIVPYALDSNRTQEREMTRMFISQFDNDLNKLVEVDTGEQNIISYLIDQGKKDIGQYNLHNIIGSSIAYDKANKKTSLTSLFNNQAFHTPAIALLSMNNMLLKYLVNESYSFSVSNHPLPRTLKEKGKQQQVQATEAYQIAQDLMFGMSFLIASFAVFIVKENATKSKHLQRVSGVNLFSFWLATFVWDFINYFLPCILVLFVFLAFNTDGMTSADQQGRLLLLFFVYGCSALPFIYCLSFLFQLPSTAYVRLCLFNIVGGIACLVTVTIMEIPELDVVNVSKSLDWLFSIMLPNYCLGRSVSNLYQNYQFNNLCNHENIQVFCNYNSSAMFPTIKPCCHGQCDDICVPWLEDYFSWNNPGIGKQLVFLALQAVFFVTLLTACELNLFRYLKYKVKGQKINPLITTRNDSISSATIEDDDVATERHKILNNHLDFLCSSNRLVLKQLTKYYGPLLAVNKLSFGVQKGECFGLLGLNGAGKTTTFKMITGDESMSSGDIYLDGHSVRSSTRKVQQRLGYCPQFDALIDQLTGIETLTMFARLRGMPEAVIPHQVTKLSCMLSFGMHIHKQVREYSGGNKRKLSTAIALIGDPPMIFLDEPTTGMDPVSRRCIWDALLQVLKSGRSIVLTSHSMEECEALCNRLVIMVNGKLCCMGSPQHLKNKFGQGFSLLAKIGRRPTLSHQQLRSPLDTRSNVINEQTSTVVQPRYSCELQCWNDSLSFQNDIEQVKSFVERTFTGCILKDVHEGLLHYHIPKPQLSWSQIFGAMERAKTTLNIEDYSVGQTTLEQVFLNFARAQREATDL